jgi:hypothetical protein
MSSEDVVSTKEIDYLDEDKPLRGQNYVCLSFISPEDVLIDKEISSSQNLQKVLQHKLPNY